ncbi:MAG: S8 family serine peptidase [bacterium]
MKNRNRIILLICISIGFYLFFNTGKPSGQSDYAIAAIGQDFSLRYVPGEIIIKFASKEDLNLSAQSLKSSGNLEVSKKIVPNISSTVRANIYSNSNLKLEGKTAINSVEGIPDKIIGLLRSDDEGFDSSILEPLCPGLLREMKLMGKSERELKVEMATQRNVQGEPTDYHLSNLYILKNIDTQGREIEQIAKELTDDPDIEYAEPNYIIRTYQSLTPNDPVYSEKALWGLDKIAAPQAWDKTTGEPSVVMAIIDTGVDYDHEDLKNNIWTNPGETGKDAKGINKENNGKDDDGNGYIDDVHGWDFANEDSDPKDDAGHGTHCAGIIAAVGNNGKGVVGVNWTARVMVIKTLSANGTGPLSLIVNAIDYAKRMGANVVGVSI